MFDPADPTGPISWYNRRWYEYTGATPEEMEGWGWQRVHDPAVLPAVLERWAASIASGEPFDMTFPLKGADGVFRPFLTRVMPLKDEAGRVARWFGTNTDVSEQKRAEAALRASEERYRLLSEALPHMIWTMRPDRSLEYFNRRWAEFTGMTPETMTAEGWGNPVHPDDLPALAAAVEGPLERGEPHEAEFRFRRHDGEYRHVISRIVPVRDESGAVAQWVGSTTDVEDRWRAEQALRESEERYRRLAGDLEVRVAGRTAALAEANAALEAFGYSVSHDLRAPLRAMQSLASVRVEDYADRLDGHGREFARRIAASAAGMDRQILDLLEYSRLSRADVHPTRVDLNDVVSEASAQLEAELRTQRADVKIEGPLPPVLGHRPTLVQILTNLLSNAAKFVGPGVTPQVRVRAENRGGRVRLWVEDNGIGIDPQHREKIFRVFERLHGPEAYPGTGIGLAIVRKGAERMGGSAGVESEAGRGSRFWVELPGVGATGGEG